MKPERRHSGKKTEKGIPLPVDLTRMIREVFTRNFESGLQAFSKLKKKPHFDAEGSIYSDEIVVMVTLYHSDDEGVAANTYASVDFDPNASAPKAEELIGNCVDALGGLFAEFLDSKHPERLEQLAEQSLSALEEAPFEWTAMDVNKRQVHVKMDKTHPRLERMTEDWLAKNDPEHEEQQRKSEEEAEELLGERLEQIDDSKKPKGGWKH